MELKNIMISVEKEKAQQYSFRMSFVVQYAENAPHE
jgi:hypothetical protein